MKTIEKQFDTDYDINKYIDKLNEFKKEAIQIYI
jgi:hypothetical protein